MARIPLVNEDDPATPADLRELLGAIKATGRLRNIYRAMANHPEALRTFYAFGAATYRSDSLTRAQAELAYTAATVANSCYY